jgi:ribonuclease PH
MVGSKARLPGRRKGKGWVTAEYGMLPRATHTRTPRGRQGQAVGPHAGNPAADRPRAARRHRHEGAGREFTITLDCDVIQADGGTRTAAITGAYVALALACRYLVEEGVIKTNPLSAQVAAVSCGIFNDVPVLDLDYPEDSAAQVDANFVMATGGKLIEIQGTGEQRSFSRVEFNALMDLAESGCEELFAAQRKALGI